MHGNSVSEVVQAFWTSEIPSGYFLLFFCHFHFSNLLERWSYDKVLHEHFKNQGKYCKVQEFNSACPYSREALAKIASRLSCSGKDEHNKVKKDEHVEFYVSQNDFHGYNGQQNQWYAA